LYSDAEVQEFYPTWQKIAGIDNFRCETKRIRDIYLLADEESIMNGTSPLIPQLNEYNQKLQQLIQGLDLAWPQEKVEIFRFYCLYHEDGKASFDVRSATRRARESLAR
jgi:hypothetical protein